MPNISDSAKKDVVSEFLEKHYAPGLIEAVRRLNATNNKAVTSVSELQKSADARLEPYNLRLNTQTLSSWAQGKNQSKPLGRGALDFKSFLTLSLASFPGNTPQESFVMLAMLIAGLWNPEKVSEEVIRKFLRSPGDHPVVLESDEQLDRIERKTDELKKTLSTLVAKCSVHDADSDQASQLNPIAAKLQDELNDADALDYERIEEIAARQFSTAVANRVVEVIKGDGEPLTSFEWPAMAMLLAELTGDYSWDANRVKSLAQSVVYTQLEPARQ
jgi:hypothetical protein